MFPNIVREFFTFDDIADWIAGAGKSSLTCALCLGLAGDPRVSEPSHAYAAAPFLVPL